MGRYAQQRKRGGHMGDQAGLPEGPTPDLWTVEVVALHPNVHWTDDNPNVYDFWQSRWRVPSNDMRWTPSQADVQGTDVDTYQDSPFLSVVGQQQDCEVMYCRVDGTPLTQWSAYKPFVP